MSYFSVENLGKYWSEELQVSFSMEMDKGTMLGIVGQSGSGKSTVLRLIAGLLENKSLNGKPSVLHLNGKDLLPLPPGKRNVGMVFQNHSLFPHLRVDDNVAYGIISKAGKYAHTKISKKESRILADTYLEKFGLTGFGNRYPDSLSGGESQRVSLARTLIVEPAIVLFDEPFSSLDAPLRKKLAVDICELQKELGFTGILVTHDIQEARTMCHLATIMKKGKQIWTGEAKDLTESLL